MNSYIDFAQYCVSYYKSWSTNADPIPKSYDELFKIWDYRSLYLYLLYTKCNIPVNRLHTYLEVTGNLWHRTNGYSCIKSVTDWLETDKSVKRDLTRLDYLIEKQKLT